MKKTTVSLFTAALAASCLLAGGVFYTAPVTANANETNEGVAVTANEIEIVEQLTWEGTPTAGWGEVRKNEHCAGGPLTVAGVTYTRNSIGSHLPGEGEQDIVYDISDYSVQYPYFTMQVAQPDGACNSVIFTVLADGVVVDELTWTHAGPNNNTRTPAVMRAYVKGAQMLTLRVKTALTYFNDGALAFIDLKLQKETVQDGYVYANRILDRVNDTTGGGYDSGYGLKPLYDRQTNNTPYNFPIYADVLNYPEGMGIHLLNVSYEAYSADKTNAANYISYKWDVSGYDFSYFSALAYQQNGFGFHVDVWADGVEISTSGKINSVGTYVATGVDPKTAPQEVGAYIPAGTEEVEVRIIADTIWNDGMVNLMSPTFFVRGDNLVSYAGTQEAGTVWPFESVRGRMWDGQKATYYNAETGENVTVNDGIFFVAGTSYSFDISGVTKNALVGNFGRAPYYPNHADALPISFIVGVEYEDGTIDTTTTEGVDWTNSGKQMSIATWKEGAKKLILTAVSDNPSFSEAVLFNATFVNKYSVTFNDGADSITQLYDLNAELVAPTAPEKEGYTFGGYALEGETTAYDFTGKTVTGNMVFNALWTANTYAITYKNSLDGVLEDASYTPTQHTYGTETALPTAEEKVGYTFAGWFIGDSPVAAIGATAYTADITVVAKYDINEYTVVFMNGEVEVSRETVDYGSLINTVPTVKKSGYTFAGWLKEDGSQFSAAVAIIDNLILTASWQANEYTITYKHQLGATEQAASGYEVTAHTYGAETVLPKAQEIAGYTFDGWYIGGEKVTAIGAEAALENVTVIGKYTLNAYTVTFVADGVETKVTYDYNATIGDREAEKDGYKFIGWYTDAECTQAYDTATAITADTTLYAGFEEIVVEKTGCSSVVFGGVGAALVALSAVAFVFGKRKN